MGLISGIFGKGAAVELPPALDIAQGDKDAARLRGELARGNWKSAQEFLARLTDWDDLDFYLDVLAKWPGRPGWLPRWSKGAPESEFCTLVSGIQAIEWAWEARGSGTADGVSDEGWNGFFSRLSESEIELLKASYMAPKNPVPWAHLLTSGMGLSADPEELDRRFAEAVKRHPLHRLAHSRYLYTQCEKWGGTHEKMFNFARAARKKATDGSLLHGIIAEAHIERWLYCFMSNDEERGREYFSQEHVRAEIEDAWEHSLRSKSLIATRRINEERNRFAFCFLYTGEMMKLRQELKAIGPNVTEFPWALVGNPVEKFAEARKRVL